MRTTTQPATADLVDYSYYGINQDTVKLAPQDSMQFGKALDAFWTLHTMLNTIPRSQKRTPVRKWHQVIGELQSMAIALPGARGLFSLLQEALRSKKDGRIRLNMVDKSLII